MRQLIVYLFVMLFVCSTIESIGLQDILEYFTPKNPKLTRVRSQKQAENLGLREWIYDFIGLVNRHDGYKAEEHTTTTKDGYIIKFHRITSSPLLKVNDTNNKPIVFLQHGMTSSSDQWVLMGPGKDLAFLLADEGYDVWMGNVRSNSYGRKHTKMTVNDPEFWRHSWHEIALYDVPAQIEYILNLRKEKDLYYVGHSMGGTISLILLSTLLEYNKKIKLSVDLAPSAYWEHEQPDWMKFVLQRLKFIEDLLNSYNVYEILPHSDERIRITRLFCANGMPTRLLCSTVIQILGGHSYSLNYDQSMLAYLSSYEPSGASLQSLVHYGQNIISKDFTPFDYGEMKNQRVYGQKFPPPYNLSKISSPIALMYSDNDFFSRYEDVVVLRDRISSIVAFEKVPFPGFNHFDFIISNRAKKFVYDRVIELIKMY